MANETIAPVVEYTAADGKVTKLCWSFAEIRKAERQIPGARLIGALASASFTMDDIVAGFLGSARKLQPEITVADIEAMVECDTDALNMCGAVLAAWDKSRRNPSKPADGPKEPVPAGTENS